MSDQAAVLRKLAQEVSDSPVFQSPFVVVTGGKGGVGKTSVAANLSLALAAQGKKVLVADLDLGLANLDVFLRVFPRFTLGSVASGEKTVRECIVPVSGGISLLPGPSGAEEMAALRPEGRSRILSGLAKISSQFDLVIADTAAGIAPDVLSFASNADRVLIVTTPEPAALTDAYALLKLLTARRKNLRASFVINAAATAEEASQAAGKFKLVAERFLNYQLEDLGSIPRDAAVPRASREQRPFVSAYPDSLSAGAVRFLARRLLSLLEPKK